VVPHTPCTGLPHLHTTLQRVVSGGGEGLMLRQPQSMYVGTRSNTLLKVKQFEDTEARVLAHVPGTCVLLCSVPAFLIAHRPCVCLSCVRRHACTLMIGCNCTAPCAIAIAGKGKYTGRVGALRVALRSGLEFQVGSGLRDADREPSAAPPIGALVTVRYQGLTRAGVPRFPTFVAVRHDVKWEKDDSAASNSASAASSASTATPAAATAAPPQQQQQERAHPDLNSMQQAQQPNSSSNS
jgi:DNA ligase-1